MKRALMETSNIRRNVILVIGLCAVVMISGCCTTKCCLSDKCSEATKCVDPYVRTQRIVDDRDTSCPNVTSSITVIPNDTVEIVNCSSQTAHLSYTPGNIFDQGGEHDLAPSKTLVLTVKSTVTVPQIVALVVTGSSAGCSHPGSKVIVGQGP